jgi:hypothetical protein
MQLGEQQLFWSMLSAQWYIAAALKSVHHVVRRASISGFTLKDLADQDKPMYWIPISALACLLLLFGSNLIACSSPSNG